MCLLILLRDVDPSLSLLIANNRDEQRERRAAPPGLWVGARRRALAPRDRRAGGTWLGVNDRGVVAGLTNALGPLRPDAPSRGRLPHAALDADDAESGARAAAAEAGRAPSNPFQLLVADAGSCWRVASDGGDLQVAELSAQTVVVTNEHGPDILSFAATDAARAPGLTPIQRLDALAPVLVDPGGGDRHPVLKRGADYGTVSSSLIAVPRTSVRDLVWRYANGMPDLVPYRNYGNLSRRLFAE